MTVMFLLRLIPGNAMWNEIVVTENITYSTIWLSVTLFVFFSTLSSLRLIYVICNWFSVSSFGSRDFFLYKVRFSFKPWPIVNRFYCTRTHSMSAWNNWLKTYVTAWLKNMRHISMVIDIWCSDTGRWW
jgi:hypothetical protein